MAIPGSARTRQARKRRATRRRTRASASYLALARAYPIHPIRDDGDLDEAIAVVDGLLSRRKPLDAQEQDYLDSLSHEIERYEAAAYPMPAVSGAAMLRHLIDAREATLSEVAAATGIAVSTLSAVLAKKRKLNLAHIGLLAPYFGVQPGVFLDRPPAGGMAGRQSLGPGLLLRGTGSENGTRVVRTIGRQRSGIHVPTRQRYDDPRC